MKMKKRVINTAFNAPRRNVFRSRAKCQAAAYRKAAGLVPVDVALALSVEDFAAGGQIKNLRDLDMVDDDAFI